MAKTLLIRATGIWTGHPGTKTISPGAVVVSDSTISAVGRPADVAVRCAAPYQILDLKGLYLLPGLINTHVHLTLNAGADPLSDYIATDESVLILRALAHAQTLLMSGVTTVRDCGSRGFGLVALTHPEVQTHYALPHILVSGPPLTPTGGHLHWMGGAADGVWGVRSAVRLGAKHGVTTLKLVATGGQLTPGTRPESPAYTYAELRAAVDEAYRLGMPVSAHCLSALGMQLAIKAGVRCIDHAAFFVRDSQGRLVRKFDLETAKLLAEAGVYVVPTLSAGYHKLDPLRTLPHPTPADRFKLDQEQLMLEHCHELFNLGIQLVLGTDAGVTQTPFDETYLELALMTQAGLSAEQALLAATYYAARVLGLGGRKGTLEPGADADIIGCTADPSSQIEALASVVWVMRNGKVVIDRRETKEGKEGCPL